MKILVIGGTGVIGSSLVASLQAKNNEVLVASRNSPDYPLDINSVSEIQALFNKIKSLDALVCLVGGGYIGDFTMLSQALITKGLEGKFWGQINAVLVGQKYINKGGSITLTSGILGDQPRAQMTCYSVINGGINSFAISSGLELKDKIRVNVVSANVVADSYPKLANIFTNTKPVSLSEVVKAYQSSIFGTETGRVIKVGY
ncbi:MAG: short chain dehydrogenase [Phycisphaerales bacterium]|nr:short chain dehydrogenase [Phycisphaerales bacterium]